MAAEFSFGDAEFSPLSIDEVQDLDSVLPEGWPTHLQVPLSMRNSRDLNLYMDGVLAEGGTYCISLAVDSKEKIKEVTFSINDHNEFPTQASVEPSDNRFSYSFTFDPKYITGRLKADSRHAFSKTVGFARVEVNVRFADDAELSLYSMDIVALSASIADNFENAKVLEEFLRPDRNQAAEWMFSAPGDAAPGGGALATDSDTDWANGSLDACSDCIAHTISLISKGISDPDDGFPNQLPAGQGCGPSFDTIQNQAVRAFIVSTGDRARTLHQDLLAAEQKTTSQLSCIDALIEMGNARFGGNAKLPARTLFQIRVDEIRKRGALFGKLVDSCDAVLRRFDACAPGVDKRTFSLPAALDALRDTSCYQPFFKAMSAWREFADLRYTRESRALHVAKPDRLYEYFCLYRLLDWLYKAGFKERPWASSPIDFFRYSIEDTYDQYENERRCANTYRLARPLPGGGAEEVDLYYVPVIYGDRREENAIALHKLDKEGMSYGARSRANTIWTPDFMLVARRFSSEPHTLIMDSKYLKLEDARDLVRYEDETLFEHVAYRYLDRIGGGSRRMSPPDQVWLLCALGEKELWLEEGVGGLLRLNTDTSLEALDDLFATVGLARDPLPSS